MNRKLWTLSNSLSILRIILVIPLAVYISSETPADRSYAVGLILLVVMTDFLDGFAARRLGQITDIGKILDPLADKIAVAVVCIILAVKGELPFWFVLVAVARDVLILAGGLYLRRSRGILFQSNMIGKWTVGIFSLYIFVLVVQVQTPGWLSEVLLIASTAMLAVSLTVYVQRFISTVNAHNV
jgi:CDP-diacylglycerol--glycerol-3-phosphate 3-phosphatidyltransferase